MNIHHTFTLIEKDIEDYYEGPIDALDTALKIAGRALSVAVYLQGGERLSDAKQKVFDSILDRSAAKRV